MCYFTGLIRVSFPVDVILGTKLLEGAVFFDIGINEEIMKGIVGEN